MIYLFSFNKDLKTE